ncbi:hypothetical protein Tco_0772196 [Tanacetum coccineum]|uniref:Uncharacterized protein n=1 Tax=Tanacetum coccineum TaxID=301880 RepID=A0ABQ4ZKL3_9ASTR
MTYDQEGVLDACFIEGMISGVALPLFMAINDVIAKAEEKLTTKEAHDMPIMDEVVFKIHKNGYFEFDPLRMIFSKMLDMLSYKLECEIWGIFVCSPRCSLEEGLTILEGDGDMNKLYDIAEKYGLINLYIAHLLKNLAEYYFKILTLDASDEEVKSKLKSYEKRKLDACSMSPHELVEWEQQEAGSPYLRTPPLKPRRKGIEFPCKNLFRDFLHCDNVADKLVLDDNWQYEGLAVEDVGEIKEIPKYPLDYTLPLVLKKKCRNKVNVTRKTRCLNSSKTMRLRKGCGKRVAIGGHGRGLGRLIGLNVIAVDDDPHVTKQVSLPARSSNIEVKDLE